MLRDIVIRGTFTEMNLDESIEVWLKVGAGAWALEDTVAAGPGPTQDFEFLSLEEGVEHVVQFRASRGGRYRAGYLSADPDLWEPASRLLFIPGSAPAAAPTINGATWNRISFTDTSIVVEVESHPSHTDLDLQLLRNGVVVATQPAPHSLPIGFADEDPPLGESHTYTARHVQGSLAGAASAPEVIWAGPAKPTGLAQVLGGDTFYRYEVQWDLPASGAVTRVQDDYLCMLAWEDRGVTAADATSKLVTTLTKNSSHASNGNVPAEIFVRARHEVTAFGATDVSEWVTLDAASVPVDIEIANDETAYHSCI